MSSVKKLFFKLCPQFMMKPAIAVVNKCREIRGRAETILFPQTTKLYCPCCGTKSKTFVAGSYSDYPERFNPSRYENTKQDVLCPVCRSLPRHRILASWCDNHKEVLQKATDILYFAPEYSMTLSVIASLMISSGLLSGLIHFSTASLGKMTGIRS